MKSTFDICSECFASGSDKKVLIVNKRHMLCERHNDIRLGLQSGKKPGEWKKSRFSSKFQYCTKWGFKKEMDMYLWIWQNRPHVSFFTGQPITTIHPWNFIHGLPKKLGGYPHYRFNPDNVFLGTKKEHDLIDVGTDEERAKYKKEYPNYDYEAFLLLLEDLKVRYDQEDFSNI